MSSGLRGLQAVAGMKDVRIWTGLDERLTIQSLCRGDTIRPTAACQNAVPQRHCLLNRGYNIVSGLLFPSQL